MLSLPNTQYFSFWKEGSSPCQRQSTGLNILWALGQGVEQFWKLVENTMSPLYLIFVISVAQANPKFYTPKNIKKAPQKTKNAPEEIKHKQVLGFQSEKFTPVQNFLHRHYVYVVSATNISYGFPKWKSKVG